MLEFGLQIYSVRDRFTTPEDTKAALAELGKMGYSHIQTAGTYDYISPELFAQYVREAGLTVCGTHYDFNKIVNDVEGTVAYHKILGTTNIGIGGMPYEYRDEKGIFEFCESYNKVVDIYAVRGFKLTYHNHNFEFVKLSDGRTMFDHMIELLDERVSFVLDAFWLQYAGIDVRDMIERLSGRIEILHLKDMTAERDKTDPTKFPIVEIGSGVMNYERIIKEAEACGVKYFVVEDDRCIPGRSLECAKISADYIKANLVK